MEIAGNLYIYVQELSEKLCLVTGLQEHRKHSTIDMHVYIPELQQQRGTNYDHVCPNRLYNIKHAVFSNKKKALPENEQIGSVGRSL